MALELQFQPQIKDKPSHDLKELLSLPVGTKFLIL